MTERAETREPQKRRRFRSFSFRLNLWYTLIFTASAASLFGVVYGLLSVAIDRNDREVVQARLNEFAAVYNSRGPHGMNALRGYLRPLERAPGQQRFFVIR